MMTSSDRPRRERLNPRGNASGCREPPLSHALVEWPFVPILSRIVLLDRAQAPSARRLG